MRAPRTPRAAVLLAALALAGLLPGCISDVAPSTTGPGADPPPRVPPSTGQVPAVVTLIAHADPNEPYTARLRLALVLAEPPARPLDLILEATLLDKHATRTLPLDPTSPRHHNLTLGLEAAPGDHRIQISASWADTQPAANLTLPVTVWAPVRLVLDAPSPYADGQNVFHATHTVPLAPWNDESGLDLLDRAASRHGFPYRTPYHDELDSYYVQMVNGTEEEWVVDGVISHSWMILHNGNVSQRAIDDLRPQANDTVELRFVRCWSTGNCEGV